MRKTISFWQMIGFVFTGIAGTLLHFLYEWTGGNPLVGAFSAVNESVWEHMKLLYFPMMLFGIFEYRQIGKGCSNFWCVKLLGTLLGLVTIPVLYYTYTGALGVDADWFNIAIYYLVAALVYWLETKLLQLGRPGCARPGTAKIGFGVLTIIFIMLTYLPPHIPLFQS